MPEETWTFRTAKGTVTVRDDAIGIRSTPGRFLAGQRARWRNGDRWDRAEVAFDVAGLPFLLLTLAAHLYVVGEALFDPSAAFLPAVAAVTVLFSAVDFWRKFLRETTIPLSDVTDVTVDEDDRTLTVARETGDGPLSAFRGDVSETTLAFPSADDLREAREVLSLRGVSVESAGAEETETTYRFVTRQGVCFCERCRSQVSPSHGACPACGYALRVETSEADRETSRAG